MSPIDVLHFVLILLRRLESSQYQKLVGYFLHGCRRVEVGAEVGVFGDVDIRIVKAKQSVQSSKGSWVYT